MRNSQRRFQFSTLSLCYGTVATLMVTYIGLIAIVMTYAVLTVEFSQSVKNDQAAVAVLESQYLANISRIQDADYRATGYAVPVAQVFVPAASVTALR